MEKEEELLRKRLVELSEQAYRRGIPFYTDFLNLNELHILHTTPKVSFPVPYRTFGGYADSERQMAAFLPDAFCMYTDESAITASYPIQVLRIRPLNDRFAEELTHRDYLGALLHLGVDRSKLGDILIEEKTAYVFASESIAPYLVREISRIRHTSVQADLVPNGEFHPRIRYEEVKGTVASERLDCLLALAYGASRGKLSPLIEDGRVFVNGRQVTAGGYHVREQDIISVRGMGRFRYAGLLTETKKGRCLVSLFKYI